MAGAERLDFGDFLNRDNVFALEVRGNSMIEDHIMSGDLVLVESTHQARDGEIVVALVRGAETTLKRFYRSRTRSCFSSRLTRRWNPFACHRPIFRSRVACWPFCGNTAEGRKAV